MKKVTRILLVALAVICCAHFSDCAYAQSSKKNKGAKEDPVISKIIEIGQTDNQTTKHLDVLSNRFGGRLIGSDAYDNAADWCEYMFKKWGLEVWREEVGELPVGFNRGPWFGRLIGGNAIGINGMALHFTTPSFTSGTKGVQRGHVVKEPKTEAEFERMKGVLKGAWVLVTGKNSGWAIDYSERGDSVRAAIIEKNKEIQKKNREIEYKNKGIRNPEERLPLIKMEDAPALFYKQMREAGILGIIQSAKVPITTLYDSKNVRKMTFETLPTIPDIRLDEEQYDIIAKMVDRREYFQLEFDIRNHFKMGPVKYHNIIGVMKGTEFPDEYVMCGGHLDAFDVATGGVDCGVGLTPALEAARMIAAAGGKPKRTILFCLWAGEEFGLLGSSHFVKTHPEKLSKISNYFNRDGSPLVPYEITVPPAMYDDFAAIEPALNRINPEFPFQVKKRMGPPPPFPKRASGSDHAPFAKKGVPVYEFKLKDSKGYNFTYREIWHTDRDLYNMSFPDYQEHASTVTAVMLYHIANLDHLLNREGMYAE